MGSVIHYYKWRPLPLNIEFYRKENSVEFYRKENSVDGALETRLKEKVGEKILNFIFKIIEKVSDNKLV